jgi:hypothetical protein
VAGTRSALSDVKATAFRRLPTSAHAGKASSDPAFRKWFLLTLDRRFAAVPPYSGRLSPKLPSRNSNRWKVVKSEVSNNERTDIAAPFPLTDQVARRLGGYGLMRHWPSAGLL